MLGEAGLLLSFLVATLADPCFLEDQILGSQEGASVVARAAQGARGRRTKGLEPVLAIDVAELSGLLTTFLTRHHIDCLHPCIFV